MENLSRNGGDYEDDGNGDELDEVEGQVRKPAKVGSKSTSAKLGLTNTIEKNSKSLNMIKVEGESITDPMFQKMSKAFDEGGAKGMLMNNLRLSSTNCSLMFGSTQDVSVTQSSQHKPFSANSLAELLNRLNIPPVTLCDTTICPILTDYRRDIGLNTSESGFNLLPLPTLSTLPPVQQEFKMVASSSANAVHSESPEFGGNDDGEVDDAYYAPNDCSADEDMIVVSSNVDNENDLAVNVPAASAEQFEMSIPIPAATGPVEWNTLGVSNANDYCFFNMDSLLSNGANNKWAGARHWKFASRKQKELEPENVAPVVADDAKPKAPKSKSNLFDFTDVTPLDPILP